MSEKPLAAQQYEKTLEVVKKQFRIAASFSQGNRASWSQEVEHLLNTYRDSNLSEINFGR